MKMAQIRLRQSNSRRQNMNAAAYREISTHLTRREYGRAEIKAETVLREQRIMEAYELLADYLELCIGRISLIEKEKICPPAIVSHVCTIIWAAAYVEVSEFGDVKTDLELKYGKKFIQDACTNAMGQVDTKVIARLAHGEAPRAEILKLLQDVAHKYDVEFNPAVLDSAFGAMAAAPTTLHVATSDTSARPPGTNESSSTGGGGDASGGTKAGVAPQPIQDPMHLMGPPAAQTDEKRSDQPGFTTVRHDGQATDEDDIDLMALAEQLRGLD